MAKSRSLWIAFTSDELELPLYVADTCKELAEYLGITLHYAIKLARNERKGIRCGYKVEKIDVGLEWRERNGL